MAGWWKMTGNSHAALSVSAQWTHRCTQALTHHTEESLLIKFVWLSDKSFTGLDSIWVFQLKESKSQHWPSPKDWSLQFTLKHLPTVLTNCERQPYPQVTPSWSRNSSGTTWKPNTPIITLIFTEIFYIFHPTHHPVRTKSLSIRDVLKHTVQTNSLHTSSLIT